MMIATDVLFNNASMYELRASGYKYNNGSSGINVDIYSKGGAREGNTPLYSIGLDGVNYADAVARKIDFCPQYYLVMAWQQILSKENEVYWRSEGRSTGGLFFLVEVDNGFLLITSHVHATHLRSQHLRLLRSLLHFLLWVVGQCIPATMLVSF